MRGCGFFFFTFWADHFHLTCPKRVDFLSFQFPFPIFSGPKVIPFAFACCYIFNFKGATSVARFESDSIRSNRMPRPKSARQVGDERPIRLGADPGEAWPGSQTKTSGWPVPFGGPSVCVCVCGCVRVFVFSSDPFCLLLVFSGTPLWLVFKDDYEHTIPNWGSCRFESLVALTPCS